MPSKAERMRIFLKRLAAEEPPASAEQALILLADILNAVEDEFSGIPCRPDLRARHTRTGLLIATRRARPTPAFDICLTQGIFPPRNMDAMIENLTRLLAERLTRSQIKVDEPEREGGSYWVDVSLGKKRYTMEYRRGKGFGLFHENAGFGEGPAEIYRTPERAAQRLGQLLVTNKGKARHLNLKDLRELYGQSQVTLAKKAGVKQPAISRFEQRDEVKLSTLAATIKALGGKLEVRAHFSDADVPISLSHHKTN
jgi:hypothetical protein